jgi:hypothetical protein
MAKAAKVTTDHDQIRRWVEARGGRPSHVAASGGGDDPGILRIDYPGFSGEDTLEEIDWDSFFQAFDENNLAFLHQDGPKSRFSKFVARENARATKRAPSKKRGSTKKASTSKKSSASTKKASASTKKAGASSTKKRGTTSKKSSASSKKAGASKKSSTSAKKSSSTKKATARRTTGKKTAAKSRHR